MYIRCFLLILLNNEKINKFLTQRNALSWRGVELINTSSGYELICFACNTVRHFPKLQKKVKVTPGFVLFFSTLKKKKNTERLINVLNLFKQV